MISFAGLTLGRRLLNVSGEAKSGHFIHIMGKNGAGKSSLLYALAGLLPLQQGHIRLNGIPLAHYSLPQLAALRCLQEQQQQSVFALTGREMLHFFSEQPQLPEALEHTLEIRAFLERPINQLSGGELRRVHIARVLMQVWPAIEAGKALILLDEPNQGLDFKHQHLLFKLLVNLTGGGNVVIVNHHDLNLCQQYANGIWLMRDGQIVEYLSSLNEIDGKKLGNIFGCGVQHAYDHSGIEVFQTFLD